MSHHLYPLDYLPEFSIESKNYRQPVDGISNLQRFILDTHFQYQRIPDRILQRIISQKQDIEPMIDQLYQKKHHYKGDVRVYQIAIFIYLYLKNPLLWKFMGVAEFAQQACRFIPRRPNDLANRLKKKGTHFIVDLLCRVPEILDFTEMIYSLQDYQQLVSSPNRQIHGQIENSPQEEREDREQAAQKQKQETEQQFSFGENKDVDYKASIRQSITSRKKEESREVVFTSEAQEENEAERAQRERKEQQKKKEDDRRKKKEQFLKEKERERQKIEERVLQNKMKVRLYLKIRQQSSFVRRQSIHSITYQPNDTSANPKHTPRKPKEVPFEKVFWPGDSISPEFLQEVETFLKQEEIKKYVVIFYGTTGAGKTTNMFGQHNVGGLCGEVLKSLIETKEQWSYKIIEISHTTQSNKSIKGEEKNLKHPWHVVFKRQLYNKLAKRKRQETQYNSSSSRSSFWIEFNRGNSSIVLVDVVGLQPPNTSKTTGIINSIVFGLQETLKSLKNPIRRVKPGNTEVVGDYLWNYVQREANFKIVTVLHIYPTSDNVSITNSVLGFAQQMLPEDSKKKI